VTGGEGSTMPRLQMRKWMYVTMAAVAAVAALSLIAYLGVRSRRAAPPPIIWPVTMTPEIADISAAIGFDLPESARLKKSIFVYDWAQEDEGCGWAEIVMNTASVDAFTKAASEQADVKRLFSAHVVRSLHQSGQQTPSDGVPAMV
jgi:hypothetical protein